jgi:hypothetical protein
LFPLGQRQSHQESGRNGNGRNDCLHGCWPQCLGYLPGLLHSVLATRPAVPHGIEGSVSKTHLELFSPHTISVAAFWYPWSPVRFQGWAESSQVLEIKSDGFFDTELIFVAETGFFHQKSVEWAELGEGSV